MERYYEPKDMAWIMGFVREELRMRIRFSLSAICVCLWYALMCVLTP
jgi:hypothetical protein